MRATTKEFVKITVILVALFLVVTHFKGAVSVIGAGAHGWGGIIRDFQGRGSF
ncbi:MAG TPA: hypothetical protein VNY83_07500 [Solirubrobacterales bacterium]|jgi:hypothetical protein|nr:hypothetical protein [Solirubrobacterales bacterium]